MGNAGFPGNGWASGGQPFGECGMPRFLILASLQLSTMLRIVDLQMARQSFLTCK